MTPPATPAADAVSHRDIVLRLNDEADLCRNVGANDIAALLDDAARHIQTCALEFLSAEGQAMERESALVAERDALRAALDNKAAILDEIREVIGWQGSSPVATIKRMHDWIEDEGKRTNICTRYALGKTCSYCECALAAPAVEGE